VDSGFDAGPSVSYRTMAFSADGRIYARSGVRTVAVKPIETLGTLTVAPDGAGLAFDWTASSASAACFTWYKLVVSTTDETPSYLTGDTYLWVGENPATARAVIDPLASGTYHFRLQALRSSEAGTLLVAETDPATYIVP
jgi:hypothetical protein